MRAGIVFACVAVLSVGCDLEGVGYAGAGAGQGCVWVCTDARACRDGASPIWQASLGGHVLCVEALLLAKADVLHCSE